MVLNSFGDYLLHQAIHSEETDPTLSCFYEMTVIPAAATSDIFHIPCEML